MSDIVVTVVCTPTLRQPDSACASGTSIPFGTTGGAGTGGGGMSCEFGVFARGEGAPSLPAVDSLRWIGRGFGAMVEYDSQINYDLSVPVVGVGGELEE